MRTWIKINGILLILFIAGCSKDVVEKEPVKTNLVMRLIPYPDPIFAYGYEMPGEGYIDYDFSGGSIGIGKIEFEGVREEGENYFFESDPENDLPVFEFEEEELETRLSDFDLPQGVYKYIRVDVYLKELSEEVMPENSEIDVFNTGLIINGRYKHHWWDVGLPGFDSLISIPFVLAIDKTEKFVFRTIYDVVIKQPECNIELYLEGGNAFNSIDYKSFEEADISGDSTNQMIIISKDKNRNLYEILLYRLGMYTMLIVD